MDRERERFVELVLCNKVNQAVLERGPDLGVPDWWLVAGAVFQTVVRRAATLFADVDGVVEVRNEARVHLWYEDHFGVPATAFRSSKDAIDHFASTTCCYALTRDPSWGIEVYAPHGYTDLFAQRVRPNPLLAPREVYERKAARWLREWPQLIIDPWPEHTPGCSPPVTDPAADR